MSMRLSEHSIFVIVEPASTRAATIDIGAATNVSAYKSMKAFSRAVLQVELGTYNASDELDEVRIQQASAIGGTNVKDLTSDASGGNYDTDNKVGSDGDFVIIEVRAEDLDVDAIVSSVLTPFHVVRGLVKEDDNGGQDDCFGMLVLYGYGYPRKELQGAASSGSQVYVDTRT